MGIRVEYTTHPLPETYITKETVFKYVKDTDATPDDRGRYPNKRVEEVIEHRGGILVKFPRGHSLRFHDQAHLERAGLHRHPKLIDEATGMECDERGVPLDIAELVANQSQSTMQDGSSDEELVPLGGEETSGNRDVDDLVAKT